MEGGVLGLLLLSWLKDIFTWGTDERVQIGGYGEGRGVEEGSLTADSGRCQTVFGCGRIVGLGDTGEGYLQVSVCFVRAIERSGLRKHWP